MSHRWAQPGESTTKYGNTASLPRVPQLHSEFKPIAYPPPQSPLTTDILTSVALTNTNHADNQPSHLRLPDGPEARRRHIEVNVNEYAGLLGRACPAQVYEYVDAEESASGESGRVEDVTASNKKFVINSQVSLGISVFMQPRLPLAGILLCSE